MVEGNNTKLIKQFAGVFGYALTITVLAPALLYILGLIFVQGNRNSNKDVEKYIVNSEVIEVDLSSNNKRKRYYDLYWSKLGVRNNTKTYLRYVFFSEKHQKWFNLITFDKIDYQEEKGNISDISLLRSANLRTTGGNLIIRSRVNKDQWNDPSYGTEEKPYPLFIMEVVSVGGRTKGIEGTKKYVDVSEEVNKKFVDQYIRFFMPKEEFIKMFGEK